MNSSFFQELNHFEFQKLLKRLPSFKTNVLKNDIFPESIYSVNNLIIGTAIPKGKRFYGYFHFFREKHVFYLLEKESSSKTNHKIIRASYIPWNHLSPKLAYGTLMEGVIKKNVFIMDDMYFCCGIPIWEKSFRERIHCFTYILNELQKYPLSNFRIAIPPIWKITTNHNHQNYKKWPFPTMLNQILYPIYQIHYHICFPNKKDIFIFTEYAPTKKEKNDKIMKTNIFHIKADIRPDIYHLYDLKTNFVSMALIPNYQTSIKMNQCFRNMKENENLDAIEDSDDESDFENITPEKYVDTIKSVLFECQYDSKFAGWVPIKMIQQECDNGKNMCKKQI
jgi:hypothetical protein